MIPAGLNGRLCRKSHPISVGIFRLDPTTSGGIGWDVSAKSATKLTCVRVGVQKRDGVIGWQSTVRNCRKRHGSSLVHDKLTIDELDDIFLKTQSCPTCKLERFGTPS